MLITPVSGGSRSLLLYVSPPLNLLADASDVTEASASDPWGHGKHQQEVPFQSLVGGHKDP